MSSHIGRGAWLEGRHQAGLAGRQGRVGRERSVALGRSRRSETQLVQTLAEAIFESHGGLGSQ